MQLFLSDNDVGSKNDYNIMEIVKEMARYFDGYFDFDLMLPCSKRENYECFPLSYIQKQGVLIAKHHELSRKFRHQP